MFAKTKTIKYLLCLAMFLLCFGIGVGEAMTAEPAAVRRQLSANDSFGTVEGFWTVDAGEVCWSCGVFNNFYMASIVLGAAFSTQIADGLTTLLAVIFGVWLLWEILKIMTPFGPAAGVADTFNKIASKLVLFIFLIVLMSNWGQVWRYFISPIYMTGLSLSNSMMQSTALAITGGSSTGGTQNTFLQKARLTFDNECRYGNELDFSFIESRTGILVVDAGLTLADIEDLKKVGMATACNIFNIQRLFSFGVAIGTLTVLYAGGDFVPWEDSSYGAWGEGLVKGLSMILLSIVIGLFLLIIFAIVIFVYPLFLVDSLFKLGIVIAISPVLVGAYFLPMTRSWTIKGIQALVGAAAQIFFLSVIAGLALTMMAATIISMAAALGLTGPDAYTAIMQHNKFKYGLSPMILAREIWVVLASLTIVAVLSLFMMRKASALAQEFTGAAAGDIGGGLAAMGRNAAVFAATTAVTMGGAAALGARGAATKGAAAAKGVNDINAGGAMPPSTGGDTLGTGGSPPSGGGDMPGIGSGFQSSSGGGSGGGASAGAGPAKSNPFPGYSTSMTSPWNPPPAGQLYGDSPKSSAPPKPISSAPPKPISDDMQNLVAAEMGNAPQSNIPSPDSALATGGSGSGSGGAASVGTAAGGSSPVASVGNIGTAASASPRASASPGGSAGASTARAPQDPLVSAINNLAQSTADANRPAPSPSLATRFASFDDNMERALTGSSSAAPGTGAGVQPSDPRRPSGQAHSQEFLDALKRRALEEGQGDGGAKDGGAPTPPTPPKK